MQDRFAPPPHFRTVHHLNILFVHSLHFFECIVSGVEMGYRKTNLMEGPLWPLGQLLGTD